MCEEFLPLIHHIHVLSGRTGDPDSLETWGEGEGEGGCLRMGTGDDLARGGWGAITR